MIFKVEAVLLDKAREEMVTAAAEERTYQAVYLQEKLKNVEKCA